MATPGTDARLIKLYVDECGSSPCLHGANCVDAINSYSCTCSAGYTGGFCEIDIDECASSPCVNGATCFDGVNRYSCNCATGYAGDRCETDIDDCAISPCMNGATCFDGVNRYSCNCVAGYAGDRCETDIDECASDPCQNGGSCEDSTNGYSCKCLHDLYMGNHCENAILYTYYQYGGSQGDVSMPKYCYWSGSCSSDFIRVPRIQIFNGQYKRLKIYTNGYVTFGLNFERRNPGRLHTGMLSYAKRKDAERQGFAMLAPLWTDIDAFSGQYHYHIYDLTKPGPSSTDQARVKHATDHAREEILKNGGVSVTNVTWVMVITWDRVLPRMYRSAFYDSPNTFQLVIAYDPSRYQTFATYIYKDLGWDHQYTIRPSMIGYFSYKYTDEETLQLAPSMKSTAFRLHERIGNTGELGRYMFRVASGRHEINYDQKCYTWFANEMRRREFVRFLSSWTLPCPCDMRLADMDSRWKFDWYQFLETRYERMCYYERIPQYLSAQECCYSRWGSLINSQDGRGGHTFLFHPRWWRQHVKYDLLPKQWCCQFSDNCDLFYYLRPTDFCWDYLPLFLGWFYGDPHIRTLDGFQYTFNGLGEYTLIETTHGNFTLQGRTAKARDANGTETDATVFSAFAARDTDSDTIHVGMTNKRNGLEVFVGTENVTDWFNGANVTNDKAYSNVTITKKNIAQIGVSFKSEFSLTIGVSAEQLDITVGASDKFKNQTKGLMGVFNGDPTDDLLPPGENTMPLSNSSSEKTIFNEFGELWRIQSIDSRFYYAPGESYSTFARTEFKPLFLEDVLKEMSPEQRTKAKETCKDNKECLFDFAVTGNKEAAAATLATNSKNEESVATLSNASPNITVDKVFNVTVEEENLLTVVTSDADGDMVTVTLNSTLPEGASFDSDHYRWTPVNMDPVDISFSASDGKGGVAAADVSVNLCNCSGHGECLFDLLADGYQLKQTFRIVQCNCSVGWEGEHCELDLDGCQDNPCTAGTNCTDVSPKDEGFTGKSYTCSACPAGTEENRGICLPINECDPVKPRHDCEQICVNQEPSFTCTCKAGYRLDGNKKNCSDIDECTEGTAGCDQTCQNNDGGFMCFCIAGYKPNADKKSCDIIPGNMEEECKKLSCVYGCKKSGDNTYVCFCKSGYNLATDLKTCEDEDECSVNKGGCDHTCTNVEGGFNCSCSDGFELMNDMKECKPCPSGTWGKDCRRDCNCRNSDTNCSVTTGCVECLDGFAGGDCHDINECKVNNPCDEHATCSNTIGTFKCVCQAGYTQYNATVCEDFDECESDPCQNGGECQNGDNVYRCDCLLGYNGANCETDIDECASSPCRNSGTCLNLVDKYRCACVRGFTGVLCETEIDICDSAPCQNGGNCSQASGKYECQCEPGYTGLNCETDFDECSSNPCQNEANCTTPTLDTFSCQCVQGYVGSVCETDIDECGSGPCENDGSCLDQVDGFICYCAEGYTGITCSTEIDECASNPCMNGGSCEDQLDGFVCNCTDEYTGFMCNIGELCKARPCLNEGICLETNGTRTCNCVAGYTGEDCETDIDECASSPCVNEATCTDELNTYNCKCVEGYTGDRCETDILECSSHPCQNGAACSMPEVNMFACKCENGYNGSQCETDINECSSHPCQNGGMCSMPEVNMFVCKCENGYNGSQCETDINECSSHPCQNGAACSMPDVNMFACTCENGYNGSQCETDINECASSPCQNGATCSTPQLNMFACECGDGYNGTHCETDINECSSQPCLNGASCSTPDVNMFACECAAGYTGIKCETDINECDSQPCRNGAACSTPNLNMFVCACEAGYTGSNCETDISECASNPCQNDATCFTPQLHMFACKCGEGYNGTHCETDIDECASDPCVNGGSCSDLVNSYQCSCTSGYYGNMCEKIKVASEITRVALKVTLKQAEFSTNLTKKTSKAYEGLKKTVVVALEAILNEQLGQGMYTIVDVTFSKGSVVVNYLLEMLTDDPAETLSTVQNAIKENNGTFAGYDVDVSSITTKVRKTVRYYGQFRVPNLSFRREWSNTASMEYKSLSATVRDKLDTFYREEIGSKLIGVSDVTFTKGSLVVDFSLWVEDSVEMNTLKDIFMRQSQLMFEHEFVDLNSLMLAENKFTNSGIAWLPIVLGTVIGAVALILVVILSIFIVRKCRSRHHSVPPSQSDTTFSYSPTFSKRPMFWQRRNPTMTDGPNLAQRYNRQRMNIVSTAVTNTPNIDWSIMRNFAKHNVNHQDDMLHRRTDRE